MSAMDLRASTCDIPSSSESSVQEKDGVIALSHSDENEDHDRVLKRRLHEEYLRENPSIAAKAPMGALPFDYEEDSDGDNVCDEVGLSELFGPDGGPDLNAYFSYCGWDPVDRIRACRTYANHLAAMNRPTTYSTKKKRAREEGRLP